MNAEEYEVIDEEEEIPHVDEKWLISYADMMTLLFGLFVLLYSTRFDVIQNSISNKFAAEKPKPLDLNPKTKAAAEVDPKAHERIRAQLTETQNKYLQTQAELEKSQADLRQSQTALENLKKTLQAESAKSNTQVKTLKEESSRLEAQLSSVEASGASGAPGAQAAPSAAPVVVSPSQMATGNIGPGTGTGSGTSMPYRVSAKLGDGTVIEDDISDVRSNSITLNKPPPLSFAGTFKLTLSHKGQSMEITVLAGYDNDGHMSRTVEIWSISTTDRILLDKWLRPQN